MKASSHNIGVEIAHLLILAQIERMKKVTDRGEFGDLTQPAATEALQSTRPAKHTTPRSRGQVEVQDA